MADIDALCEECMYLEYDEELEEYNCSQIYADEDDYARMAGSNGKMCPYFRRGNEYTIVRKQN
ncbi:MAG: hypothetical protein J6U10_06760 [Lachnospiraceae bacterium]|nr:hypothetical protein [Lachnospiraceae bacterium]MBP5184219.1 hypothetical protein [Lachnospiraceae bacterium]